MVSTIKQSVILIPFDSNTSDKRWCSQAVYNTPTCSILFEDNKCNSCCWHHSNEKGKFEIQLSKVPFCMRHVYLPSFINFYAKTHGTMHKSYNWEYENWGMWWYKIDIYVLDSCKQFISFTNLCHCRPFWQEAQVAERWLLFHSVSYTSVFLLFANWSSWSFEFINLAWWSTFQL